MSIGNTKLRPTGWAEEKRKQWQESNPDIEVEFESLCKITFTDGFDFEHMWVKVTSEYNDKEINGILWNNPILLDNYEHSAEVRFSREDIMEYLPPTYVDPENN